MKHLFALVILFATGCGVSFKPVPGKIIDPAAKPAPPKVVFMGDSITYLFQEPGFGQPEWDQHFNWIDRGVVGDDSGQMSDRFQKQVVGATPDMVVILAGTNDVYPDWQLCGGLKNWDTCAQIAYMVGISYHNHIKPILATIPPWGCAETNCALAEKADSSPSRYDRIDALNAWIKKLGAEQGLVVVDYHAALVASDRKTYIPGLTFDGVHPSGAGYAKMAPLVEDAITATAGK